ncbi:MAG: DNA-directed RNA polymerase subunit omega [Synergistaceae bacterium]|jgi:DNA-directed RNA polymerase subunit K/omega|nr:DNA-directed RNA polymerase subunit omega [Synergistaceae bacterium]
MIYMDLEKIYAERDIPNKYILTLVVAARARQLSERKGPLPGYDEKFITKAVEDVTNGCVKYKFVDIAGKKKTDEPVEAE